MGIRKGRVRVGARFGRLVVRAFAGTTRDRSTCWHVRCDCGKDFVARGVALSEGRKVSCGCFTDERRLAAKEKRLAEGFVPRTQRPEYNVWVQMRARCAPGGNRRYFDRGIRVHPRWEESFDAFFADVGPRPSAKHSLDRIDNDGHYEPGNVRWATAIQQANNQSHPNEKKFTIMGQEYTLSQICAQTGISKREIMRRIKAGESIESASSRPVAVRLAEGPDDRPQSATPHQEVTLGTARRARGHAVWRPPLWRV